MEARARQRRRIILGIGGTLAVLLVAGLVVLAASGGGESDGATTAQLTLDDFTITGDLEVPAGEIRLEAVNIGAAPHNVGLVGGPISREVPTGEETAVDLGVLEPGTYQLYCDVVGHVELGMVADFIVTEPPPPE